MSRPAPFHGESRASDSSVQEVRDSIARALHDEVPPRASLFPLAPDRSWYGLPAERIELISRGDVVNGILARGATSSGQAGRSGSRSRSISPLLIVAHDAGSSASAPELRPIASWVEAGLGVVVIDLPLHGHRASAKLSERLVASISKSDRGEVLDPNSAVLVEEFRRQATIDLIRTLDALLALGDFDPKRVGLLGLGLGARLGNAMLAWDERLCAAVLADDSSFVGLPASAPAANGTSGAQTSTLALGRASETWIEEARSFLASRLGF